MKKRLFLLLICSLLITGAKANLPVYHSVAVQTIDDPATEALFKKALDYYTYMDFKHALPLFKQLVEKGHAPSQFYLAEMYWMGDGVRRNDRKAFELYKKSADQGYTDAESWLSSLYYFGSFGAPKDINLAYKYSKAAAEKGNLRAQSILESCRKELPSIDSNDHGNITMSADEAFDMGYKYDEEKDYQKAIKYYKIAVEKGSIAAANNLGTIYLVGYGVEKDYAAAFRLFMDAAKRGVALSQYKLGYMYYNGCGVNKDYKQAFEWFLKAAEQNNTAAQCYIGYLYYNGEGVTKNYASALKWSLKAAEQGDGDSQYLLGLIYSDTDSDFYDAFEAYEWFGKAAESDSQFAKDANERALALGIHLYF